MINTDYADDPALLAYGPVQAKPLLYSLEQTARGIRVHLFLNKKEPYLF